MRCGLPCGGGGEGGGGEGGGDGGGGEGGGDDQTRKERCGKAAMSKHHHMIKAA